MYYHTNNSTKGFGIGSNKDIRAPNKPAMEKVELVKLASLPASATNREREGYIEALHDSLLLCKGRHLECAWYIGRQVPLLKAKLRLEGKIWKTSCEKAFNIGDRQARSYIKIAETFPTNADLKELLNESDSIRQAVELAKTKQQEKEASDRPQSIRPVEESGNLGSNGESPRNPMLAGRRKMSRFSLNLFEGFGSFTPRVACCQCCPTPPARGASVCSL